MDINVYQNILRDMKTYNDNLSDSNYGNVVVGFAPSNPTYPLTIFDEIRNTEVVGYTGKFQRLASLGYRVDIYAKTKGNRSKQAIARTIASQINTYLTEYVGLQQVSWNVVPLEDDSIYHIVIMYSGNYHENRMNFK